MLTINSAHKSLIYVAINRVHSFKNTRKKPVPLKRLCTAFGIEAAFASISRLASDPSLLTPIDIASPQRQQLLTDLL